MLFYNHSQPDFSSFPLSLSRHSLAPPFAPHSVWVEDVCAASEGVSRLTSWLASKPLPLHRSLGSQL